MFSQEDISLAFDKLEPHWNEIQAEHKKREEYFLSLINNDYAETAELLKCHLVIEHYEPYRVCRRLNILRDYSDEKTKLYPRN